MNDNVIPFPGRAGQPLKLVCSVEFWNDGTVVVSVERSEMETTEQFLWLHEQMGLVVRDLVQRRSEYVGEI